MVDERRAGMVQAEARARLTAVETAYSDAEHDLTTALTQPRLFDRTRAATARFRRDRERTRHIVHADPHSWTAQQSVADLESSWQALRADARQAGLSDFSWWQRHRIRLAGRLLERARSDRGSPRMRSAQYFRGLQLLDGLLELSEPLRREVQKAAVHTEPPRTPGPDFPTSW